MQSVITPEWAECLPNPVYPNCAVPQKSLWDAEADVLYISFRKPSDATDSELADNDVIVRYENDEVIGLTILHASTR